MMDNLSQRERRMIAILILCAALALGWLLIIEPIATGFVQRASTREQLQLRYAADQRLIASMPRLRRMAERQRADRAQYRMVAADEAEAGELLKERITGTVSAAGGQIRSAQDVESDPGWAQAWVEVRLTLPQLVEALENLQNQPPLMVLSAVAITSAATPQDAANQSLDVRIEGAVRHEPAKPR